MTMDIAIWSACLVAQAIVIALLFFRNIWRTLPVFFAYCIWDVASNVALYFAGGHFENHFFFHIYFARAIIDSAFIFCVLVELAWSVLRPVRASLPRSAVVLLGVLILVAGAAIWPFAALPGMAHATTPEGLSYIQLQQTTWIVRILVFVVLAGAIDVEITECDVIKPMHVIEGAKQAFIERLCRTIEGPVIIGTLPLGGRKLLGHPVDRR